MNVMESGSELKVRQFPTETNGLDESNVEGSHLLTSRSTSPGIPAIRQQQSVLLVRREGDGDLGPCWGYSPSDCPRLFL